MNDIPGSRDRLDGIFKAKIFSAAVACIEAIRFISNRRIGSVYGKQIFCSLVETLLEIMAPLLVRKVFIHILPLKNIIQPSGSADFAQYRGAKLDLYKSKLLKIFMKCSEQHP